MPIVRLSCSLAPCFTIVSAHNPVLVFCWCCHTLVLAVVIPELASVNTEVLATLTTPLLPSPPCLPFAKAVVDSLAQPSLPVSLPLLHPIAVWNRGLQLFW